MTMTRKISYLRTPESCFEGITDFPYAPSYLDDVVGGLRLAYYDIASTKEPQQQQQQKDNTTEKEPVFLCLHGEPTWSYLYRHMIPTLSQRGRVICVDLLGLGRSDKPVRQKDYSFTLHRMALLELVETLNLQHVTLVVQDWGGILGLTLPLEAPQRYQRLMIMNTMLPIEPEAAKLALDLKTNQTSGFAQWHAFSQSSQDWDVGQLIHKTCRKQLSPSTMAAYNAPFLSQEYKAGVNVFPRLVPLSPDQDGYAIGREALHFWRHHWTGTAFMGVGGRDRVIPPPLMQRLHQSIRGCAPPLVLPEVGHFVQEQAGQEVAEAALQYFDQHATPPGGMILSKL